MFDQPKYDYGGPSPSDRRKKAGIKTSSANRASLRVNDSERDSTYSVTNKTEQHPTVSTPKRDALRENRKSGTELNFNPVNTSSHEFDLAERTAMNRNKLKQGFSVGPSARSATEFT